MASFTVAAGTTQTARISMGGADDLTVEATGTLSVAGNAQSVRFNAPTNGALITNNGTIENTAAAGRAIRFETSVGPALTATIDNAGTVQSLDDAIQIQGGVTSGTLTINNSGGTIQSTTGQAIDLAGGTGAFVANITNDGSILGLAQDAIRFGGVGILVNSGTIDGGSSAGYTGSHDGIQFEDNSSGTVTNNAGGTITGDRHAINGGNGTVVGVINSGTINGRNGSGVGLDGSGSVTNHGTITGAFSDSPGSDINGPLGGTPDGINDGDGDGVDIDGQATIVNYGVIQGTGAGGHGSDGLANTSEGIAAGGGSITNHAGATISGLGLGILIDSSQGSAPFQTAIVNYGTIAGINSAGIRIVSSFADTIVNNGTISGGGGVAILFGAGDNTLSIGAASSIVGLTDGEGGSNSLDYSSFGFGGTWVNLASGVATGTGGVQNFQSVIGSAGSDVIIGDGADNSIAGNGGNDVLAGGDGADTLSGGAGHDVVNGGDGDDVLAGGSGLDLLLGGGGNDTYVLENGFDVVIDFGGVADLAISTISRSLLSLGLIGVENLTLVGVAAADGTGNHLGNTISGNDAANTIDGWLGNDTLSGHAGNDLLIGGFGFDTMTGGLGDDIFRFTAAAHSAVGTGADVIADFDDFGNDRIDLSALTGPALAYRHDLDFSGARQVRINDVAGDDVLVEINLGGSLAADMQIRLAGTDLASMTASDFLL